MKIVRRLIALCAAVAALMLWPVAAQAHPLGNFTVNVYDGLVLSPGRIRVLHVVDMAEIPTFQELRRIRANGEPTDAELTAWAGREARRAVKQLSLTAASRPVALNLQVATAELRPGQGGLPTLRLEAIYTGGLPARGTLEFDDGTYRGRIGWREVTATGTAGTAVLGASVPSMSKSGALRAYPDDLLSDPPRVVGATVSFRPGSTMPSSGEPAPATGGSSAPGGVSTGAFADLANGPLTPAAVAMSIVLALGFGALHAMGPGHGKTIMAAYLVVSGGRVRHAVGVAVAVAGMHTTSVLALGMFVLTAERAFPAERIYPWLGLIAGALGMALGAGMLAARLMKGRPERAHHHPDPTNGRPLSRRGLAVLAASGGLLPSPTAIVVLLASIALGRAAFGVALVGAFSLGLAVALALVGVFAVHARSHLAPRLGRWARFLPIGSASAITAVGALVVVRAAAQI